MTLHVRMVDLTAATEQGEFGARLRFRSGLNVISAENTKGKSTLVQSIVFGLGLEKMLSPRRQVPLPRAMTVELQQSVEAPYIPVLASRVTLEVENGKGDVITLQRSAKGEGDLRLVSVFLGPRLSDPGGVHKRTDYYALDPGAAQSSTGLHHFLADFLGWDLPSIPRHTGGESPLYLEAIFSLAFVEQKAGWAAIPANFPTYMGLKDMGRRSVEYVLGLKVNEAEVARQRLHARAKACRERWSARVEEANRLAGMVSGRVEGVPADPDLNWEAEGSRHLSIPDDQKWVQIDALISRLKLELEQESAEQIPTAAAENHSVKQELVTVMGQLTDIRAVRRDLIGSLGSERAQLRATERQLANIEEDLQRHKDATKILSIGGRVGTALDSDRCPTCHQQVGDSLLPPDSIDEPMNLEENRRFLLKQRDLFRNLGARSASLVEKQERELVSLGDHLSRLHARSRALQDTLGASSSTPSVAAIQHRVELQGRLDSLGKVSAAFSKLIASLVDVREEFRAIKVEEAKLPPPGLPEDDRGRLQSLSSSIVSQLRDYGFSTFRPSEIQISPETYRPIREGFEIGFELSASDAIRLKWAYQLALLEVTRGLEDAHHPGLLVFDEPRQQETSRVSFHRLIARASLVPEELQVLFTTSEHKPNLRSAISDLDLNLIDLPGYLLQPRSSDLSDP